MNSDNLQSLEEAEAFNKKSALFLIFSLFFALALSANELPYKKLSQRVLGEYSAVSNLATHPLFQKDKKIFDDYEKSIVRSKELLDRIEKDNSSHVHPEYLFVLRGAESALKKIEHSYFKQLSQSIERKDKKSFYYLSDHHLGIIKKESVAKHVCNFYETYCQGDKNDFLDALVLEKNSNDKAYKEQMIASEEYAENLKTISLKELDEIKSQDTRKRKYSVVVASEKNKDGFTYIAENFFNYRVSVTLEFKKLDNFRLSKAQPIYFELAANERREIVRIIQIDKHKKALASTSYSVVMGSASAIHDDSVLYRLPFAKNAQVYVSQGFNGDSTHTGLSAYSVDFPVPEGTAVYAARSGVVFATQDIHNKGGFAKKYGKFANYIIVEHSDRTLGKYWHLKKGGVAVHVGQQVKAGDLLGYSGNTGYSSGPHLHFNVSMVDPISNKFPKSIPIRFKTAKGIINAPKSGDVYMVQ